MEDQAFNSITHAGHECYCPMLIRYKLKARKTKSREIFQTPLIPRICFTKLDDTDDLNWIAREYKARFCHSNGWWWHIPNGQLEVFRSSHEAEMDKLRESYDKYKARKADTKLNKPIVVHNFAELAAINNDNTIFASNTSSLSITAIAKAIPNPARFAGLHFFNPAHLMNLVEIVQAVETSDETIMTLKELCAKIGKTAVVCKDSPGFIVNRVARNFYTESLQILEDNAAKMENIDALLESAGFKMGPFKLMDTIGNDINFAVTSSLYNSFHQVAKFRPSRIQEQKVVSGNLGKKTGKGFYNYE
jgi:hypothetical protein